MRKGLTRCIRARIASVVPTAEREQLAGCSNIVSDPEILRSRGRTLSPGTFPHPPAGSGSGRRLFAGDGVFAALTLRAGETNGNAAVIATYQPMTGAFTIPAETPRRP